MPSRPNDYPHEMMSDCRHDLRDVTVTAMDIAVVIQGCSEALTHPVTQVRPFPDNRARVLTSRAGAHKLIAEYDRAIADLDEAIQLLLKRPDEHNLPELVKASDIRNEVRRAKDEYDRAIANLGKILGLDPEAASAFDKLALIYSRDKKDYDRAIVNLSDVIRFIHKESSPSSLPGLAGAFYQRANAYSVKGEYDRALADLGEYIRLYPEHPLVYLTFANRGFIYARFRNDYDRAIADFDEALRRRPRHAYTLTSRGLAYKAKGELDRASADLNAAEQINAEVKAIAERHWRLMAELKRP